ncbi:MAG: hypothetical protein J6X28_00615 [Bacilli bacterium]|nr:hypothetical protein [Bacilli bacterium]
MVNYTNPGKALEERKEQLFQLYQEDYGEDSMEIIRKRWENTIFIFEDFPKDRVEFCRKMGIGKLTPMSLIAQAEYRDYLQREKELSKEVKKIFQEYMQSKHQIYGETHLEELWEGDSLLKEKYGFGVACDALEEKKRLLLAKKIALLSNTLWGKNLIRKYPMLSVEQLAEILYQENFSAITGTVVDKEGKKRCICYVPIMRYQGVVSLDRMVLHELRHVVETGENQIGLEENQNPRYSLLNEVRTDRNAIKDEKRLSILFERRNPENIQSIYEVFLLKLEELDAYEDFLNQVAFQGTIEENHEEIDILNKRLEEIKKSMAEHVQKLKNMI